jgi:hypothetical protein
MAVAINLIILLLQLTPQVIKFVRDLEAVIPESQMGSDKKALLNHVLDEVKGVSDATTNFEKAFPILGKIVDISVAIFKKNGVFSTSTPPIK